MLLVYLGGMATAYYRLLPYTTIRDAVRAAEDWQANWRSYFGIAPTKFLVRAEGELERPSLSMMHRNRASPCYQGSLKTA